jgi:addiction module HigA family antidote
MSGLSDRLQQQIINKPQLSITAAARELNIGRPALSNVLSGKAALSPELAVRIENRFGLDARELLVEQLDETLAEARAAFMINRNRRR